MPDVCLETARTGHTMAFAPDIPGAYGWGPDRQTALAVLAEDIRWKARWLNSHGLALAAGGPLRVVETVPATGTASHYDTEGFFRWDARAYTDREVEQTRQIISWSRADLMALLETLPRGKWDVRLDAGKRTVAEVADHIAVAEWWYTWRIDIPNPLREDWREYPRDPAAKLAAIRADVQLFLDEMARLHPSRRARQFVKNGETWTGRKVLRRMIWHEIHHYKLLLPYIDRLKEL
ncbi:MAG TPA: DinB family protein [Bacillota bacterium]|nr:DinB family protein [Bacillota bacterium]